MNLTEIENLKTKNLILQKNLTDVIEENLYLKQENEKLKKNKKKENLKKIINELEEKVKFFLEENEIKEKNLIEKEKKINELYLTNIDCNKKYKILLNEKNQLEKIIRNNQ